MSKLVSFLEEGDFSRKYYKDFKKDHSYDDVKDSITEIFNTARENRFNDNKNENKSSINNEDNLFDTEKSYYAKEGKTDVEYNADELFTGYLRIKEVNKESVICFNKGFAYNSIKCNEDLLNNATYEEKKSIAEQVMGHTSEQNSTLSKQGPVKRFLENLESNYNIILLFCRLVNTLKIEQQEQNAILQFPHRAKSDLYEKMRSNFFMADLDTAPAKPEFVKIFWYLFFLYEERCKEHPILLRKTIKDIVPQEYKILSDFAIKIYEKKPFLKKLLIDCSRRLSADIAPVFIRTILVVYLVVELPKYLYSKDEEIDASYELGRNTLRFLIAEGISLACVFQYYLFPKRHRLLCETSKYEKIPKHWLNQNWSKWSSCTIL